MDTPQQIGVVERKHRHLLETARALFFQANLPLKFWGDCVQSAVHLINRMPLTSLNGLTPYEKLFGSNPSCSNLKIFSCLCYASTLKHGKHKFQERAQPCIFLIIHIAKRDTNCTI